MTSGFSSERVGWYVKRLAAMSPAEVAHRVREQTLRRLSRSRSWTFRDEGGLPTLPLLKERLQALPSRHFDDHAAAGRLAAGRAGTHRFLGCVWPACARDPLRWHLDPVTGRHWPSDRYCFAIPFRHVHDMGDVKYVWELNRLQHLQAIAAWAARTGDDEAGDFCRREIASWIAANPPFLGLNWASGIELALRVVSLIIVVSLLGSDGFSPKERSDLRSALAAHGHWLHRYPSRFSSANNHLVAEAGGLFLLGSLAPDLPGAARWRSYGRRTLIAELERQILSDGVGAEQSPTYTAFSLEWWLLCASVARELGDPFPDASLRRIAAAGEFLRCLLDEADHHPRIGDDDEGRVLALTVPDDLYVASVLDAVAAVTGRGDLRPNRDHAHLWRLFCPEFPERRPAPAGPRTFVAGGYSVVRERAGRHTTLWVFDHGPLGYLSIAAHGHADALAVWLHLDGSPVLVDAGTYLYHSGGRWRDHFRGTAAHNTLMVAEQDASRIAGPFNWSRKAAATLLSSDTTPERWRFEAEHDGFVAAFQVRHRRRFEREADGKIIIEDRLVGASSPRPVDIGFLLHPSCTAEAGDGRSFTIRLDGRPLLTIRHEGPLAASTSSGSEAPPRGWYSPAFGSKQPATRLAFTGSLNSDQFSRITITFQGDPAS